MKQFDQPPTGNDNDQLNIFGQESPPQTPIKLEERYEAIRKLVEFLRKTTSEAVRFKSYEGDMSPEVENHTLLEMLEIGLRTTEDAVKWERKYKANKSE